MSSQSKKDAEQLLIEADAVVKLCYWADLPNDPENSVKNCALLAVSRLMTEAIGKLQS